MKIDYSELEAKAAEIRRGIVKSVYAAASGHPGGSLSGTEILTALYFGKMDVDKNNPKKENRDRFVLSKGHAAPLLYSTLAEKGFFDKELLTTLRKTGSILQGHPDMKKVPGVDISTGSLGQGFSTAVGMALGLRVDKSSNRVYALLGDGELQEGIIWEAAMSAAHYHLDNLTIFIDYNGLQIDGKNEDVMSINPLADKWKSFGWHVLEINGHSYEEIFKAIENAEATKGIPTVIIAKTIKGKGISFMEDEAGWHGKAPNEEEFKMAMKELGGE